MDEDKEKSLIPRPGSELAVSKPKANQIVSRMTRDVLARTQSQEVSQARFKLGDYEFREPDYRQILRWSEHLVWLAKMHPEDLLPEYLLEVLQQRATASNYEEYRFTVQEGAITTLVWNIQWLMQPPPSTWEPGLVIEELCIQGVWPSKEPSLRPALPCLRVLELQIPKGCRGSLRTLDLSLVPGLTKLNCGVNELTELDLSGVRVLTELVCNNNQLTELDLSKVPQLTQFYCDSNQLTELDLSGAPHLTELGCGNNQLTELDLSAVRGLTALVCDYNQLTELNLSAVPNLEILSCLENQLTELDLSGVPNLRALCCDSGVRIKNAPRGLELFGGTIVSYTDEGHDDVCNWPDDMPL